MLIPHKNCNRCIDPAASVGPAQHLAQHPLPTTCPLSTQHLATPTAHFLLFSILPDALLSLLYPECPRTAWRRPATPVVRGRGGLENAQRWRLGAPLLSSDLAARPALQIGPISSRRGFLHPPVRGTATAFSPSVAAVAISAAVPDGRQG